MAELPKISRARVMKNAHYMYEKAYCWYRTMKQIYTFSDFLAYAWEEEKENVAAQIEIAKQVSEMESQIKAIRMRRNELQTNLRYRYGR